MSDNSGPVRVTLQMVAQAGAEVPPEALFSQWVNLALQLTGSELPKSACVTIRVVDEVESSTLNAGYRDIDKATNVLAFPAGAALIPELADEETELGDLVICYAVVAREAREQHKNMQDHMAHMAVHGALHLVGYDHQDDAQATAMEALETRVLCELGLADPYN